MGRIDFAVVGKGQQFAVQAVIQFFGEFRGAAGEEVGAADITDEQGVAGKNPDRGRAPVLIADHVTDMLRSVPRGFPHGQAHVLQFDRIALGHGPVFKTAIGRSRSDNDRSGPGGQLRVPGNEIGVKVGFDDMGDPDAEIAGRMNVNVHVALGIGPGRACGRPTGMRNGRSWGRKNVSTTWFLLILGKTERSSRPRSGETLWGHRWQQSGSSTLCSGR